MTPEILAPPFYLAAGMIAVTGLSKLRRPRPAAQALYAAGVGGGDASARALGAVELSVGVCALARPAPPTALALAAMYLMFAAFLAFLKWRRPETASCGCVGDRDVPPNLVHLGLDLLGAGIGLGVAVTGAPGVAAFVAELRLGAVPVLAGLAGTGVVVAAVATEVPAAFASYRPPQAHADRTRDRDRHLRADDALAAAGIGTGHSSLWPGLGPELGPGRGPELGRGAAPPVEDR